MVIIAQETPGQDEVLILLRQSDAFAAALYPPESCHMVDVDALTAPTVRFFVARLGGSAVGCGALVLGDNGQA
jgi:putative acetyltransferase